jgi:hypothetical protein
MVSGVVWWNLRGWPGRINSAPPAVAPVEVWETTQRPEMSDTLRAETVRLRRSLHALEKRVSQLAASPQASVPVGEHPGPLPTDVTLKDRVQRLTDQVAALADRQRSMDLAATDRAFEGHTGPADQAQLATALDVALAYDTTLADQAIEAEWNQNRKNQYAHFFHTEDLAGAQLQAAECRTTLCRVEVALDNQDALAQLVHHFSGLLEPNAEGFLFMEDEDALYVTIYLSRGGYTLPAQGQVASP